MASFDGGEWTLLCLWVVAIIAPIAYAITTRSSLALGITLSVLLGSVVQVLWSLCWRYDFVDMWVWSDFVLVPSRLGEPMYWHTAITAGFLHNQGDLMHVLSNVIILGLVGVPLEQRLGTKRYALVYVIGLLGGSLAWFAFNATSNNFALGASGAAFGLLGAYLAGWPRDEIPFPLLLIRPWPVTVIALLYFALEAGKALMVVDGGLTSSIGHMAHVGGFLAAYLAVPLIARNGPYPLGVDDGGPKAVSSTRLRLDVMRTQMVNLTQMDDPWTMRGQQPPKHVRSVLDKLRFESDEPETRLAWMEQLANLAQCSECSGPLGVVERVHGAYVQCSSNAHHFTWPPLNDSK